MRSLSVYLNELAIGVLAETGDVWSFEYDQMWAQSPLSFDLSPALSRHQLCHVDGASTRTVQWYFDNLLPEETQRTRLGKEAGINGEDAFALLQFLGAESAGSLVLLAPGALPELTSAALPLAAADLSQRIRCLPSVSLSHGAPKRMSVAGAQNKLLVLFQDGELFEPQGTLPSTHILKPEHDSEDYPNSVINEFAMMTLAGRVGLAVPPVTRLYVPEPVYIVERFDRRWTANGKPQRSHIIDACQLLNKPRAYKYSAATMTALVECIALCANKARARMQLFRWLVFNVLIGNDDIHLKNLSFSVTEAGVDICAAYDLLSTAVYHTRAYADDRAMWPNLPLMIPLSSASTFNEVSRMSLMEAALVLGLAKHTAERELQQIKRQLLSEFETLMSEVKAANQSNPAALGLQQASDIRLLSAIRYIVLPDMLAKI